MIREFFQNSIDAKSENIEFNLDVNETDQRICTITFKDDGVGMSRDTILNKLLSLGGTTKSTESTTGELTVGGFGAAKMILLFAHDSYSIKTQDNHVIGSGGEYVINKLSDDDYVNGTEVVVNTNISDFEDGYYADSNDSGHHLKNYFIQSFNTFISNSLIDGVKIKTNFNYFDYSTPYVNKKIIDCGGVDIIFDFPDNQFEISKIKKSNSSRKVQILVNGVYMFQDYINNNYEFVDNIKYNIKIDSTKVLTTNRDGFSNLHKDVFEKAINGFLKGISEAKKVVDSETHLDVDYSDYVGTDKHAAKIKAAEESDEDVVDGSATIVGCYYKAVNDSRASFEKSVEKSTESAIKDDLEVLNNTYESLNLNKNDVIKNLALINISDCDNYDSDFVNTFGLFIKSEVLKVLNDCKEKKSSSVNIFKSINDDGDFIFKVGYSDFFHIGFDFSKDESNETCYLTKLGDNNVIAFNVDKISQISIDCYKDFISKHINLLVAIKDNQYNDSNLFATIAKMI